MSERMRAMMHLGLGVAEAGVELEHLAAPAR